MITSPLRPSVVLYVGMVPPASFDVAVPASEGFPPILVIAAQLKVEKPSGALATWACSIIPDDEETQLIARRSIQSGDLDEAGVWHFYLEVQFGTSPGNWMRLSSKVITVFPEFQESIP